MIIKYSVRPIKNICHGINSSWRIFCIPHPKKYVSWKLSRGFFRKLSEVITAVLFLPPVQKKLGTQFVKLLGSNILSTFRTFFKTLGERPKRLSSNFYFVMLSKKSSTVEVLITYNFLGRSYQSDLQ